MTDDLCDYTALKRMWSSAHWFAYVGRTRRQRAGLTKLPVSRAPRGMVNGIPATECSGEIQ